MRNRKKREAEAEVEEIEIGPQPRQEIFLASPADIAIYGGAAGGGKTWALLMEPLRHVGNPQFGSVVFRRTQPEIIREGGMWDEAEELYPYLNAVPNLSNHSYRFPSGAKVTFSHLQKGKDLYAWRGAQIPLIEFDQLETFEEEQFWYMMSRNRSKCGVRPYVRATANPQPGWLAEFLDWWIEKDGYANLERSGKVRWMIRENDKLHWSDDPKQLKLEHPNSTPKSVTFIVSTIYDNPILLEKDPGYLANLQAQSFVERQRLLGDAKRGGNWKIKPAAGKIFNRAWFGVVEAAPAGGRTFRFTDLAATEEKIVRGKASNDPDFTASVKMKVKDGVYYILDVTNERTEPAKTDSNMLNRAQQDGVAVPQRFEQEPGSSGKRDARNISKLLNGFDVRSVPPRGDKILRCKPLAAQAEVGNVKIVRAPWNEEFLTNMHNLGEPDWPHDDIPDAASGCYDELNGSSVISVSPVASISNYAQ